MKSRIFTSILIAVMVLVMVIPVNAGTLPVPGGAGKGEIMDRFERQSQGRFKYYAEDGQVFVAGTLSNRRNPSKADAGSYLKENQSLFASGDAAGSLFADTVIVDEKGGACVTFSQKINGIKVWNSQINIQYNPNGTIISISGEYQKDMGLTALGEGAITPAAAIQIARKQFSFDRLYALPAAEKMILAKDGELFEAYKVNIYYDSPQIGNWDVFVELHTGQFLYIVDNIRDGAVVGSGTTVQNTTVPLNLNQTATTTFKMQDMTKASPTYIYTYTMNNTTLFYSLITNTTSNFSTEVFKAGVSAHYNAGVVYDFYKTWFNRNSLDNAGMALRSYVHYGNKYNNAFWDGSRMFYGDGDGTLFTYFSGDLDVVGHEMTHGVISREANLTYSNQSGALNESLADVFGVLIETYDKYVVKNHSDWIFNPADWVVGDDIYTPGIPGDALRSLYAPGTYGDPEKMSEYYYTTSDNGGVHTNSGIPNRAAAMIAEDIGMEKTAKIYYKALTDYMTASTNFAQAYNCIRQAAVYLYPAENDLLNAIDEAFIATEIISVPVKAASLTLSADLLNLAVNESAILTATVKPDTTTDKTVTWSSSDPAVATVNTAGTVTGLAQGTATVTATTNDGSALTASCSVTVTPVPLVSIVLTPASLNLSAGQTSTLGVIYTPANASNKTINWSSDNPAAATVDTAGKVTAAAAGSAVITAASAVDGNINATCLVTVTAAVIPVTGVTLNKTTLKLAVRGTYTLVPTISPANATNKSVTWTSSNTSVATVDANGKVTAVARGTATITVTTVSNARKATCRVSVR